MSKHILLISQYFHPEVFRVNDMACEWVKRGYKVTVLTGIPNYPMGKYYEGYDRKQRTRETWNDVSIIRIPLIARGNSNNKLLNAIGMVANYLSFIRSGQKWVNSKEAASLHVDLVFTFEVSPMTQAMIGVWYGQKYHTPTFLYVQDLWPENVELVTGIHSPLVIGPINKMVDYIYHRTDRIFTTSESFRNSIINRKVRVSKEKTLCWHQYAEDFYQPYDKETALGGIGELSLDKLARELLESAAAKIAFTGNIGVAQGLDILPRTAQVLNNRGLKPQDIRFIIVGDGRYLDKLVEETKQRRVEEYFCFAGRQPAESIPYILALIDIAYLTYPDPQTIPAKLQSYMACGKCIVASAEYETKRIIEEADCGICSRFGDEYQLADAIGKIISDKDQIPIYGERARNYFLKHFEKKKLMDQMDEYIRETIG